MNWVKISKKAKYSLKIASVNITIFLILFVIGSVGIRTSHYFFAPTEIQKEGEALNRNTIRGTYPNYSDYTKSDALAIFTGYAGPGSSYAPFIGWRRNLFNSKAVVVESQFRTRRSINQAIEGSVWFFGGSTMWGTGATDDTTIPSYFSKQSGENVWNLGESGFSSFQELVQLQILLANGLKPKLVVFYDGVNDSYYCNKNVKFMPTHCKYDKYLNYIKNFPKNRKLIKELRMELAQKDRIYSVTGEIRSLIADSFNFVIKPYYDYYRRYTDKRAIGIHPSSSLSTNTPFSNFRRKKNYKVCGDDAERANKAAKMTVETWLIAHDLLKYRGIPSLFILQPSAHIQPNTYQLYYLLDSQKQRIADETGSYSERYELTKQIWFAECSGHSACDKFHDLSEIFVGEKAPIFIDAIHISPNGNEIVAKKINEIIDNLNLYN